MLILLNINFKLKVFIANINLFKTLLDNYEDRKETSDDDGYDLVFNNICSFVCHAYKQ